MQQEGCFAAVEHDYIRRTAKGVAAQQADVGTLGMTDILKWHTVNRMLDSQATEISCRLGAMTTVQCKLSMELCLT